MVDKGLVLRKLAELQEYLAQVKEYASVTVEEYEADWKTQRIVERTMQMMIETCVDIAGHIISDLALRTPTSYADAFKVLHESDILPEALFSEMEKMAKFRNIVVHRYDRVDAGIVVAILGKDLNAFVDYQNAIISLLEKNVNPV